jgi:pimeloyl-ACP methyl ester carboxylesterase
MADKKPRTRLASWPEKGSALGLRSFLGETAGRAGLLSRPPAFPPREAVPRGAGQGVLVIPGFLTGDMTTGRLRAFLTRSGYLADGWGGGINLGPRSKPIQRLKVRVEKLTERTGGKVLLAGVSLGGVFAREIAKMMPEHVAGVATLCSPLQLPVPTPLAPFVTALQRTFDKGLVESALGVPVMPSQPMLVIYSKNDGVVDWRTCVPPPAKNLTILEIPRARHMTIGSNPEAQEALGVFLGRVFPPR